MVQVRPMSSRYVTTDGGQFRIKASGGCADAFQCADRSRRDQRYDLLAIYVRDATEKYSPGRSTRPSCTHGGFM